MRVGVGALVVALGMSGCASNPKGADEPKVEPRAAVSPTPIDGGMAAADARAGGALASVETLASHGPQLAAGMREVARGEVPGDAEGAASVVAHAEDHDTCVRVVLSAPAATRASLTDARGDVLAEATTAEGETALGAHGPVCVRKGDSVTLHATMGARFVTWASP